MSTEKQLTKKEKLEIEEKKNETYNVILIAVLLIATVALIFGNFIVEENKNNTEKEPETTTIDDLPTKNYE